MARFIDRAVRFAILLGSLLLLFYVALTMQPYPERYEYGVSFMTPYADALGLDWEEAYEAILRDLAISRVRLAAHWPMIEPQNDAWNFAEIDRQMELAEAYDVEVVLAVGRRVPRWPECHVPDWARALSWDEQKEELRSYLTAVVERYKDHPALVLWQVENEPFLTVFAYEHCGDLDTAFLDEELARVRALDSNTPILVTDSGNLGLWFGAYARGDVFGTSVYVYLNNEQTGPIRTILPPEAYLAKRALFELVLGKKDVYLIELSLEPWVNRHITETPIETQLSLMSIERMAEVLAYGRETRMPIQYLWGVEWWYWLREQGHPEHWDYMQRYLSFAAEQ